MSATEPMRGVAPCWQPGRAAPVFDGLGLLCAAQRFRETVYVVGDHSGSRVGVGIGGGIVAGGPQAFPLNGVLAPVYPEWLGDRSFAATHGARFPYVVGEMARCIANEALVVAAVRAGFLGFFGAAGLAVDRVEQAVEGIRRELAGTAAWGVNVIHQPEGAAAEQSLVSMLLAHGVERISASAFVGITEALAHYALAGLYQDSGGRIRRHTHVLAKVSRPEVGRRFMSPAPPELVERLRARGAISTEQAQLGRCVPLAQDVTVEADSAGHTDNRPLTVLLPEMRAVGDYLARQHRYLSGIRIGAAGGIGTATAAAAAFAMGAAYVLTGSINQTTREAGNSDEAKRMLCAAGPSDFAMAPSADMFELGARVQVLRRGTLFAQRASRLHDLYSRFSSLDDMPESDRRWLEDEVLRDGIDVIWQRTEDYLRKAEPALLEKARCDPHRRMALVFRWYLASAGRWATEADPGRRVDYQIWAGPSLGACNRWLAGTPLAEPTQRTTAALGLNILEGAAAVLRASQLRSHGVPVPPEAFDFTPRPVAS